MARPKTLPPTIEKICPICNRTFSVSYYLRNKRTYCGKKCSNADPEIKRKIIAAQTKTFAEKYGMHPMKTELTKENLRLAVQKKYGVDWISESDGWINKVKQTKRERYGDANYLNPKKREQTCIERYGEPNYTMTEEYKEKYKATCLLKYGFPHASMGKRFKIEHNKTMFEKFMSHPNFVNFSPQFTVDEYSGVSVKNYMFKCNRCGTIKSCSIDNGKYPICPSCDKNNCSTFQSEIYEYIKSVIGVNTDIKLNDRTLLSPKELDIVIPSLNLAVECDGVLWHSELFGHKNKTYHLHKTSMCLSKGYRLIHIWDNEWRTKREIVKSVLAAMLNKPKKIVFGRKCEVHEISSRICVDFLNENHLQGTDHSSVKLGLFDESDNLISVMTFLKSRFDKKIQYEMGRFCNKLGYQIHGGASKLFSYFLKKYSPTSIVSYNDRRYFDGQLYINLGFQFMGNTSPNGFCIIDNYQTTQNRICWQKHKLEKKLKIFDASLSAWENMKNNGYDRIWDCGNGKWVWNIH
jgi:very-short-patch-repair endonuclease